jgi:hypothetical protein
MSLLILWAVDTNVSEEHTVSIFRAEMEAVCFSETLVPYLPRSPRDFTTQKTNTENTVGYAQSQIALTGNMSPFQFHYFRMPKYRRRRTACVPCGRGW